MRRARWTMLAVAGLVLMGSDGAVRSDCPQSGAWNCVPLSNPMCIWAVEMGTTCELGNLASCGCVSGSCTSDEQHVPQYAGYELLLYRMRPAGCCKDISWGYCFQ
ncbi:MAG: hypothetical protein HBSAPP02_26480 [Phycisphaerae bacterium]|nr:MAG: hypothetical protein HBSAPP02_26480 [Phycisphaerae bacterium]